MSKKSSISVTTPKSGLNPNTPTYNPLRWQSTYQLALPATTGPPPGLWTPVGAPITAGFGYGYPFAQQLNRFAPPPPIGPHSNYCCFANQRHQCGGGYDHNCNHNNGWPTTGSNCWANNHRDDCHNNNNNTTINGVAITEVKDDSKEESDDDSSNDCQSVDKKQIKELKQTNEELTESLEKTKQKLRETEETLLKFKEQLSFDSLEYYRKNLKKYGDFIRQEVNRFYQNEDMAQKLKPIVEQISNASHHIKQEKERTRQSVLTARQQLKDDKNPDLSANLFSPHSLPDFPDLLTFYKSILDEIPLIFLEDLSQLKRLTNNFIQTKKLSNNGLPISSPFGDEHSLSTKPLPSASNSLFSAPNISDLPKPDFNTLPLKPVPAESSTLSVLEFNFPRNSSPIPSPDSITDGPISTTELLDIIPSNKTKEKPISPIAKPLQPVIDLKAICAETVKNNLQNNPFPELGESFRPKKTEAKLETDFIRPPNNPIPRFTKPMLKPTIVETNSLITPIMEAPEPTINIAPKPTLNMAPKTALNMAQSKLLVKLREKYPQMSDGHLIDSMSQTKALLIASGNTKGFSGLKVADIINKISEYIDTKVLTNSFSKPRLTEMKSSSAQNNFNAITDKMVNKSKAMPSKKAWNTLDNKTGKYDDSICSICFESISITSKYETECQHFFHHSCINNWIRTDGSCPICRRLVLPPGEFPEL